MTPEQLAHIQAETYATFREETTEGLERLERRLLNLRQGADRELVDELFRVVHTIKGSAGGFGLREMSALAHAMEAIFDDLRNGGSAAPQTIDFLLEGADTLRQLLQGESAEHTAALVEKLTRAARGPVEVVAAQMPHPGEQRYLVKLTTSPALFSQGADPDLLIDQLGVTGTLELEVDESELPQLAALDPDACYLRWRGQLASAWDADSIGALFDWLGDLCKLELEPEHDPAAAPLKAVPSAAPSSPPRAVAAADVGTVRVAVEKIDALMDIAGELVITESTLSDLGQPGRPSAEALARAREALGRLSRLTRTLHESVLRLRSMPIGVVFNRFPRLVDDLCRRLDKQVDLEVRGEGTELDKTVIERLGDPLVHLVRNSIDHGVESAAEREAAGKAQVGRLTLAAEQRGSDIYIEISDDGRGLDADKILARARERGLIPASATPSEAEILRMIFMPGFSTAAQVSDISGRGVGLDVVAKAIAALGGEVQLDSVKGKGTTISLRLPLTLAIVDGQLVKFGGRTWVMPLPTIRECVPFETGLRSTLFGREPVYRLRDEVLPLVDPCALFELPAEDGDQSRLIMVVEIGGERVGLLVDEMLARQQVVIKSLQTHYDHVDGLSGATILGDGTVAYILDTSGLRGRHASATARPGARHVRE